MIKSFIFITLLLSFFNAAEGVSIRSQSSSTTRSGAPCAMANPYNGTLIYESCEVDSNYNLQYLPTRYLWFNTFYVLQFTQTNEWVIGIADFSVSSTAFSATAGGYVKVSGVSQTVPTSAFTNIDGTYLEPLSKIYSTCVMQATVDCVSDINGNWRTLGGVYFPALGTSSFACAGSGASLVQYSFYKPPCPSGLDY